MEDGKQSRVTGKMCISSKDFEVFERLRPVILVFFAGGSATNGDAELTGD